MNNFDPNDDQFKSALANISKIETYIKSFNSMYEHKVGYKKILKKGLKKGDQPEYERGERIHLKIDMMPKEYRAIVNNEIMKRYDILREYLEHLKYAEHEHYKARDKFIKYSTGLLQYIKDFSMEVKEKIKRTAEIKNEHAAELARQKLKAQIKEKKDIIDKMQTINPNYLKQKEKEIVRAIAKKSKARKHKKQHDKLAAASFYENAKDLLNPNKWTYK